MIVDIGSGSSGWGEYVLGKDNERNHATLIMGDTELGDKICDSVDYAGGNYVRMVVSFAKEDNVGQEQGRALSKEFVKKLMYGYREDEYHADIVEHTDTDHLHYHIRIPKVNLLTQTQLKVYWHRSDLNRKIAIIDQMALEHRLTVGNDFKKLNPNPTNEVNQIESWRKEHGQAIIDMSSQDLSTKKR
ncbi:MAG: relaxase/mobilization nuclease domain-containing protein [Sulfurovum sp.]|nr:relaxase/mobilization nuclease domain-containing protein [Sulfurovum sp.]